MAMFVTTSSIFAASITGKIVDDNEQPLVAANVVLLEQASNKVVKTQLSDEQGVFLIDDVNDGAYVLKITMLGFEEYSSAILNIAKKNIDLEAIAMKRGANKLKGVSVRGQKPLIEVKAGKIVMNVASSSINVGSSVLEVLGRSPGVNVDQNDNISLKGRQGVTVMIDGKPMAVSGTDLANILKGMQSSTVEQIEIISNPGAKYDAAGVAGIINIRTKKDKRMGMNGSVNANYAQGVYPKAPGGINLNYRNKKISAYTTYNTGRRWWFNKLELNRRFYDNDESVLFSYDQVNYMKMAMVNHRATLGVDYYLTDKTILGVVATGGKNDFNPQAQNDSKAIDGNGNVLYQFTTVGKHTNDFYNYTGNLNLRHRFNNEGRMLTVDLDYARYWNQSNQNFETAYQTASGTMFQPNYYMRSDLTGITQIRSFKTDYTHPLKNKMKLETGLKSSYVTSDNEPLFYERTTGEFALDTKRSNHFIYRENINAAYANFNKDWTKWSTQLGVRLENTNVDAEQVTLDSTFNWSYTQLFPSFAVQRHLNKKHDLGVTLSRRIQRPNYQQLNPFKFFIDNTTYKAGYPYLRPALTYAVELSHTFKQRFSTTLTYSVTNDNITEVIQPSDTEDSVTVQTNKNLATVHYYGVSGSYPFQIRKWWSNFTNVNVYYAQYIGQVANTNLRNGSPAFTIYTMNNFMLPKGFSAEASFWYQSRMIYGFMDLKEMWKLNFGLKKNLFDNKATLALNIQDVFWKGWPRATSTYSQYQEDFQATRDTRIGSISFTYRFGKRTVAPTRKRKGGAADEMNRVSNGAG